MERLTAFEFIAATDVPQLVRLSHNGVAVLQFAVNGWIGVDLRVFALDFETQAGLLIEGVGLGKPFWNDELPSWVTAFDPIAEQARLAMIRQMVKRETNRLSLVMS